MCKSLSFFTSLPTTFVLFAFLVLDSRWLESYFLISAPGTCFYCFLLSKSIPLLSSGPLGFPLGLLGTHFHNLLEDVLQILVGPRGARISILEKGGSIYKTFRGDSLDISSSLRAKYLFPCSTHIIS